MALIDGDGWGFEISEWWDHSGTHYDGAPSESELLNEATQLTGHLSYDDGQEEYFSLFSHDGWLMDELEAEADDAADYYEE